MPYSVLGPGMLKGIDEAAKLVKREARIVPRQGQGSWQHDTPASQHNYTA